MTHDLQSIITDIGVQATALQNKASDPAWNIWVNASAGTGKTKVLTDRVLRLLLPTLDREGTDPKNILCLTFTKAGANEMITRMMRVFSQWAVCSENDLYASLEKLLGHRPSLKQKDKARQLFAQVIDSPEGLNITTIHAFCQSVLGRFTLEAGLSPNFKVMEEFETSQIIKHTRNNLINDCLDGHANQDVRIAFKYLSTIKNADQINKIFQSILNDRNTIQSFINNNDTVSSIYDFLNVDVTDSEDNIFKFYFSDDNFPKSKIEKLATALTYGTDKNKSLAKRLNAFCSSAIYRDHMFDEYQSIFLTKGNEPASTKKITKGAREFDQAVDDIFTDEAHRILTYKNHLNSYFIAQSTTHLLTIAKDIIDRYENHKKFLQKLDYDDLIEKTRNLLTGNMRDWVLYKLDYQLDHILVDEAQDTSPEQWGIIEALLSDFYSGDTSRNDDTNRTIFVVGDKKQSIFSFQGASPKIFSDVQKRVQTNIENAQKNFQNIPMNTSFRSAAAILDCVDNVFDSDEMRIAVAGSIDTYNTHTSYRQGQAGRIELWPLYKAPETVAPQPWQLPIHIIDNQDAQAALAQRIGEKIANWIKNKDIITSSNKPVTAGDIMILVRRRNAMVDHLIRALKSYDVPVSGADRLVITNHIAVKDILAVLNFAMMPDDDLTLATILKSPFIGWDDETLEDYAYNRDGTLWNAIKQSDQTHIIQWFSHIIETISGQNAFHAISGILNLRTPNNNMTGWQSILARLGADAIDPVEELLTLSQHYDADHPSGGIQGFIKATQSNTSDIKRELEGAGDMVRIMTVHASKGLQAPIVILPDTVSTSKSSGQSDEGFQWINDTYPLWSPTSSVQNDVLKSHKDIQNNIANAEYNRLLYVAMTRAQDRLIICGTLNKNQKTPPEKSWYSSVFNGMNIMDSQSVSWPHDGDYIAEDSHAIIYETKQTAPVKEYIAENSHTIDSNLPDWVTNDLAIEHHPPKILKPSQDNSDPVPVRSPLTHTDDTYRFRRGLLTHALLQYLPDVPADNRNHAGVTYLKKQAPDVSEDVKDSILSETLAILNDPEFAPYFATGSMAEVPVTGIVNNDNGKTDIISGQIDRLLITDDTVWVVDFKSNRPPPQHVKNVPALYRNQLSAYKALIADIYPNHIIRCALLWTDGPRIMELEDV